MLWALDKNRALCPQIYEKICLGIALGELKPDEKLFSVREVAALAGVNPNTVQRSFEALERDGILYSVRSSGWFVSADTSVAKNILEGIIEKRIEEFFSDMSSFGLTGEEIKQKVKEHFYE
jgi:DNA-binding transcriptional regulator YhcF (GntR family)